MIQAVSNLTFQNQMRPI